MSRWGKRLFWALAAWRLLGPMVEPRFRAPQQHPLRLAGRTMFLGDREVLVRETGPADGPVLVLLHGLGGASLAEFYKLIPLLADRYRLIIPDQRNHGRSDATRERFEIADLADDLAALLDTLDLGEVAVLGYSLGGAVAQAFAHRYPDRVSRLVLVATLTHHPEPERSLRRAAALVVRAWERLTGWGTPEARAGYLGWSGAVAPEHARWSWLETHRREPDTGAIVTQALLRFDTREWIGKVEQPVLVVIPTHDQLVPAAWQYRLAGELRTVSVVEVLGARHEVPWTHPELLADAVHSFLRTAGEWSDGFSTQEVRLRRAGT